MKYIPGIKLNKRELKIVSTALGQLIVSNDCLNMATNDFVYKLLIRIDEKLKELK